MAAVQIAGGSHQRDRAATQHLAQSGQGRGPFAARYASELDDGEGAEPRSLV